MQSPPIRIKSLTPNAVDDDQIIHDVQRILLDAIQKKASDVHFEPYKKTFRIRIRVDGILHETAELSPDTAQRITARLKVISNLDIAERRLPQDGRFNIAVANDQTRDCRISTCPTLFGEKIVVRILDTQHIALDASSLGFSADQMTLFLQAIQKPQGMILVTGPTGSGKTITLYTALKQINTHEKNISTVEDPIEIELPGINQIAINPKIDFTFATALRSLLRQDPDIIMIGEIRDKETADIAIKAAQTGHLVLSTLHTNSAADAISRLMMMGASALNLAQCVQLIIAQRLVRKLCERCKKPVSAERAITPFSLEREEVHKKNLSAKSIFQPVGCDHCLQGYDGRTGIFEFLPITANITQMIANHQTSLEIAEAAKKAGLCDLRASALEKIRFGVTSVEEANRVIL